MSVALIFPVTASSVAVCDTLCVFLRFRLIRFEYNADCHVEKTAVLLQSFEIYRVVDHPSLWQAAGRAASPVRGAILTSTDLTTGRGRGIMYLGNALTTRGEGICKSRFSRRLWMGQVNQSDTFGTPMPVNI